MLLTTGLNCSKEGQVPCTSPRRVLLKRPLTPCWVAWLSGPGSNILSISNKHPGIQRKHLYCGSIIHAPGLSRVWVLSDVPSAVPSLSRLMSPGIWKNCTDFTVRLLRVQTSPLTLCCSVTQSYLTLCNPRDCSTPGFPVLHHLLELAQTQVHQVSDAIQPSHPVSTHSPPALNLSQHQGLFQWVSSSHQVAKVLKFQHQSFQRIFRIDFLYEWLVWCPCSSRDSQESSSAPQFKASILWLSAFFMVQLSHSYMTTRETIALTRRTFVSKALSLFFNMLSRFVITFLPRSKCLNFMAAVTICSDFGDRKKIKSVTVSIVSPSICHEVMGPDAMILVSWMLSFKPAFSLSSFIFIKRLFSSSLLSVIGLVSVYISQVVDISPGNLDSSWCFIQSSILPNVLYI